jgi:hypothetical protein
MNQICKHCDKFIEGKHSVYANHVRWCKKNPNNKKENIKFGILKGLDKRLGKIKEFKVKCNNCNKIFIVNEREKQFPKKDKYFCNRSCANTRKHSKETKDKIRKSCSPKIKEYWNNPEYVKKQMSKNSILFSKGEVVIRTYFKWNFPNQKWTFGGCLKHNDSRLVRDLYSKKLKVCIEYDGIWHFEDIHGQLKDKQKIDKALEDWCIQNDYRLIRIKEDVFLKDEDFWIDKLVKEVKYGVAKIIKFY